MNNSDLISIITVSKNAEKTIEKTIESIFYQTYACFEYIIIDGASTDDTLLITERYKKLFEKKGISFRVLSEEDNGIYDAMNKGIKMAIGEWVIFMNANDCFYSNTTLQEVFDNYYDEGGQCIYGDTVNCLIDVKYIKKSYPIDVIYYKAPFIHQALFCKKDILVKYMFDTRYKYAAEYDQFLRMYLDGVRFKRIKQIIACFDMSGVSQNNSKKIAEEWKVIQKKNHIYHRKYLRRKIRMVELLLKKNQLFYRLYLRTRQRRNIGEN
ncbi:glycosyltransferase family 2 protein [Butyrivibrio sp. MC2021]|uniref:glycosyltransferase family 2 protein n=1 Tax=Butyrivibrio sp. MC2021 TaxID=1408306 RepID=UPI0006852E40|nr:glycosyltransferase family 2 protein [Butyrivibrio sp. MC2021]